MGWAIQPIRRSLALSVDNRHPNHARGYCTAREQMSTQLLVAIRQLIEVNALEQ